MCNPTRKGATFSVGSFKKEGTIMLLRKKLVEACF